MKNLLPNWIAYRLDFPGDARREARERRAARETARAARKAERRHAPANGSVTRSRPLPAAELGGTLRLFRAAALWGIALLITTAAGAAFTESYRGLLTWAEHHSLTGFWAAAFPLQLDVFVAVGELVLFVAMTDRWGWRDRAGAWTVALLGLAASVAGNVGHVAAHDLQSRGTAAVPPIAAFAALWLGLGVVKRIVRYSGHRAAGSGEAGQEVAAGRDETARLDRTLDSLAEAVRVLADRTGGAVPAAGSGAGETVLLGELLEAVRGLGGQFGGAVPSPDMAAAQSALLGELLEAVRDVGARIAGMTSAPVPAGAEDAALIAMRATVAASNPLSLNQLCTRFSLTRAQAVKVRKTALGEPLIRYGHEENEDGAALGPVPRLRRFDAVNGSSTQTGN